MDDEAQAAQWVRRTIRAEMVKGGWTYASLTEAIRSKFRLDGEEWNEKNVANKVARGTCSATFFVRCLMAMGVNSLHLDGWSQYDRADPDGRRYRFITLRAPQQQGLREYEVFGVTGAWRYVPEVMKKLIQEGRVVQPRPGSDPVLKQYEDEARDH